MSSCPSSSSPFSELPEDLWKLILCNVPLRDRLGSCSLVSQRLRSAATAATEDICVYLYEKQERADGLITYLHKHFVTRLEVHGAPLLTHLPPCPHLRTLELKDCRVQRLTAAAGFSLPVSLQRLLLSGMLTIIGFGQPACGIVLDPAVLRPLTNLVELNVFGARLVSGNGGGGGGGDGGAAFGAVDGGGAAAALLAVLPALQQLQFLGLHVTAYTWPAAAESSSYSALVPSSTLTKLDLSWCALPVGALQHVFTPGRLLPQLQCVSTWDKFGFGCEWDQAAVSNLVSSCPGLRGLQGCFRSAAPIAALTQLSALTALDVTHKGVNAEDDAALVQAVAVLTNLQSLNVQSVSDLELSRDVLTPLAALKQLKHLRWWQRHNFFFSCETKFLNRAASDGAAPDVWQQLLEWINHHQQ